MPTAHSRSPIALWAPVLAYMALIFALSSISRPPATPAGTDKLLHALLYAGLGLLFARAWSGGWTRVAPIAIVVTMIFGTLYGASDELHQYFNPPRQVEAADLLADAAGATLGAAALYAWGIIRGRDGV